MNMKKPILLVVLILTLLVGSVTGTTYAFQASTETSGTGTIQIGTLDAQVQWSDDLSAWNDAEVKDGIFSGTVWKPNHTQVRYIKIINNGSLEFNYSLSFTGVSGRLADVIEVYCGKAPSQPFTSLSQLVSTTECIGTLAELQDSAALKGALLAQNQASSDYTSGEETYVVALHMRSNAGNEYQGEKLSDFTLTLNATQFTQQ